MSLHPMAMTVLHPATYNIRLQYLQTVVHFVRGGVVSLSILEAYAVKYAHQATVWNVENQDNVVRIVSHHWVAGVFRVVRT